MYFYDAFSFPTPEEEITLNTVGSGSDLTHGPDTAIPVPRTISLDSWTGTSGSMILSVGGTQGLWFRAGVTGSPSCQSHGKVHWWGFDADLTLHGADHFALRILDLSTRDRVDVVIRLITNTPETTTSITLHSTDFTITGDGWVGVDVPFSDFTTLGADVNNIDAVELEFIPLAANPEIHVQSFGAAPLYVVPNIPTGQLWPIVGTAWDFLLNIPDNLASLASLTGVANKVAYFTGLGALALTTLSSFGRSLIAATNSAEAITVLGLSSWASALFQPLNARLTDYHIIVSFAGIPANDQIFAIVPIPDTLTLPTNLSGMVGKVLTTNPTASYTITVKKNNSSIGTITISTSGVFTASVTATTFSANDYLSFHGQATADATLKDFGLTIKGNII